MKRWTKQQFFCLSRASDGHGIVLCDIEAGYPGKFNASSTFEPGLMMPLH